jgi:hypothetical protein
VTRYTPAPSHHHRHPVHRVRHRVAQIDPIHGVNMFPCGVCALTKAYRATTPVAPPGTAQFAPLARHASAAHTTRICRRLVGLSPNIEIKCVGFLMGPD